MARYIVKPSSSIFMEEQQGDTDLTCFPGFRFHPTEEELINFYLLRAIQGKHVPSAIIRKLDIYRYDPWELPGIANNISDSKWYFIVPRVRRYANGVRPNRVAVSGYWKATGTDRRLERGRCCIGLKKTLVFYIGRAPKGKKSNWIMNEYRMPQDLISSHDSLDTVFSCDIVLCCIHEKITAARNDCITASKNLFITGSTSSAVASPCPDSDDDCKSSRVLRAGDNHESGLDKFTVDQAFSTTEEVLSEQSNHLSWLLDVDVPWKEEVGLLTDGEDLERREI